MRLTIVRLPVIAASMLAMQLWFAAVADQKGVALDDVLSVADFGSAAIDPAGRWLVYEQQRPYDRNTDYSFRTYAMGKSGHQLWKYDLSARRPPERLSGLDPEKHSFLDQFSPSGDLLTVMQYSWGSLRLGVYDLYTDGFVAFPQTPAFSRSGSHNPVWISADEIVFSSLPEGEAPEATSVRVQTARMLSDAWEGAWRGDTVTALEISSAADGETVGHRGQLIRAVARSGATRVLADGLYADLRLSPDGTRLAALRAEPAPRGAAGTSVPGDAVRYRLVVFDLTSDAFQTYGGGLDFFPYTLAWAPGGERLAVFGWPDAESPQEGRFHVLDLLSGDLTVFDHAGLDLTSERERGWLQRPERTAFFGDDLAVFARPLPAGSEPVGQFSRKDARPDGAGRADWYAVSAGGNVRNLTRDLGRVSPLLQDAREGSVTILSEDGVFRIFTDGQRRRLGPVREGRYSGVAAGTFATRSSVIRPEFSDEILVRVDGPRAAALLLVDLRPGREAKGHAFEPENPSSTPVAGNLARAAVALRSETRGVVRLSLLDNAGTWTNIAELNPQFSGIETGEWRSVSYSFTDRSGAIHDLASCVLLPPDFHPAQPPPLIVDVYPNVRSTCPGPDRGLAFPDPGSPYIWAGKGYAYVRPSTPRELIRQEEGPIAGLGEVMLAGVSAITEAGLADPDKLVLHGFSQGAVAALFTGAQGGPYRAVIARNGWADLFSHYFGPAGIYAIASGRFGEFGRYDPDVGSDFNFGTTPFDNPDLYYRNSPVFLAPGTAAPVMLVHSDMDGFSMHQFDEMYSALVRAGKDVRYVRYLGEGHGPSSPANIRDLWDRMETFLKESGAGP